MDLNHDKQIQSLLCYRYTIGQTSATKVGFSWAESRQTVETLVKTLKRENVKTVADPRPVASTNPLISTPGTTPRFNLLTLLTF